MKCRISTLIKVIGTILIMSILLPSIISVHAFESSMEVLEPSQTINPIVITSNQGTLTVRYGLEQQARYGRKVVISIDVDSKTLEGKHTINLYLGNSQNENTNYGTDCVLEVNEVTTVQFTIPMIREVLKFKVVLKNADGETIVEATNPFRATNFGTYKLVGILSDLSTDMSYFNAFGSKCYYMDKSNFPNDKDGLDILDVIIVNNFDSRELKEEQFNALIGYVKSGGLLVLGSGKDVLPLAAFIDQNIFEINGLDHSSELNNIIIKDNQFTIGDNASFSKLLQAINTYENNRISELSIIEERNRNYVINTPDTYIGESMITGTLLSDLKQETLKKAVANFEVENAGNLLSDDGVLLFQELIYGNGNIILASFDLGIPQEANKTTVSTAYLQIANLIYSNISGENKQKLEIESYGSTNNYNNYGLIGSTNDNEIPSIHLYVLILLTYIVLIGPIIYFVLKRFEKSKYLWCISPVTAILFVIVIYSVGSNTRITNPYVGYISVERYDKVEGKMNGEIAFQLSFPTNEDSEIKLKNINEITASKISFPQYSIYNNGGENIKQTYVDMSTYTTGIHYTDEEVILESFDIPAFSKNLFSADYSYTDTPIVVGNLSVGEQGITGSITNKANVPLEEAFVFCDGILVSLGTLDVGASVKIDDYPNEYLMNTEMIYYSDLIEKMLEYDVYDKVTSDTNRKSQALRSVIEELQTDESAYFITFSDMVPMDNPIYELASNRGSYGLNVIMIPLEVAYGNETSTFVTSIDDYMDVSDGESQYIYNYRYMLNNMISANYSLPRNEQITALMVSEVFNRTINEGNSSTICEEIYLYNYTTKEYDLVFDLSSILKDKIESKDENFNKAESKEDNFNKAESKDDRFIVLEVNGEDLKKYLSDNVLRVKYNSNTTIENISILPKISYRKEASNARN